LLILIFFFERISSYELIGYWGQSDNINDYPLNIAAFDIYSQINVAFAPYFTPNPTCTYDGTTIEYIGLNLAGYCWATFGSCTNLLYCPDIGEQIQYRQQKGQRILISLGGASGIITISQILVPAK
jgi:hypothetical protein